MQSLTAPSGISPWLTRLSKSRNSKLKKKKKVNQQKTLLITEQGSSLLSRLAAADLCLLWFAARGRAKFGIFPKILLGTCSCGPQLIWKGGLCAFVCINVCACILWGLNILSYLYFPAYMQLLVCVPVHVCIQYTHTPAAASIAVSVFRCL